MHARYNYNRSQLSLDLVYVTVLEVSRTSVSLTLCEAQSSEFVEELIQS